MVKAVTYEEMQRCDLGSQRFLKQDVTVRPSVERPTGTCSHPESILRNWRSGHDNGSVNSSKA